MPNDREPDLTTRENQVVNLSGVTSQPVSAGQAAGPKLPSIGSSATGPTEKVSGGYLARLTVSYFGTSLGLILPLSYSLAVRISILAPGHPEVLGYVTGSAQIIYLILSPLIGMWSDRTATAIGRRTPFVISGALVGLAGLLLIALAPNVVLIGVGWVIGLLGWATSAQAATNLQADKVPEEQRGRISALSGFAGQIAPVLGIGIAYTVKSSMLLLFMVPGLIAVVITLLPLIRGEGRAAEIVDRDHLTVKRLLASYAFSPRKYPEFGWNFLGRFIFFMGLYFNTTFGAFFYSERLGVSVANVAGTAAIIGGIGVLAAMAGAIIGGTLSDKFRRRKLFTLLGAIFFVAGAITEAFAHTLPQLILGAVIMQIAIALFSAVDQAITFAILPDRTQTARYLAVNAFSQKIPSGIAPLIAPFIIAIGASGADKNYTILYLAGGVLALIGGLVIFTKIKTVR